MTMNISAVSYNFYYWPKETSSVYSKSITFLRINFWQKAKHSNYNTEILKNIYRMAKHFFQIMSHFIIYIYKV